MPKWYLLAYEPFAGKHKGQQSIETYHDHKVARVFIFVQHMRDNVLEALRRAILDYVSDSEIAEVEVIYPISCDEVAPTVCKALSAELFPLHNGTLDTRLKRRFVDEFIPRTSSTDSSISSYSFNAQEARKMPIAQEIMVKPPRLRIVDPETNLYRAWVSMLERGIGHLPVVESRHNLRLKGMVTQTDLYRFTAPPGLPDEDKEIKEDAMSRYTVTDPRVLIDKPICVAENAEIEDVVKTLVVAKIGSNISLVPVVSDEDEKRIVGVISYVEVMRAWNLFPKRLDAGSKTVGDIATPYHNLIRFTAEHTVAYAINRLKNLPKQASIITHHRHIVVCRDKETDSPISLLDERELQPFVPLDEADTDPQDEMFFQTRLGEIKPRYPIDEVKIDATAPVWEDTTTHSAVYIFLESLEGDRKWIDRKTGLLVYDSNNKCTGLVTPTDCIRQLVSTSS